MIAAVVDDEPLACELIKNILLKLGNIEVVTYNSVNSLDQDYDFILLDIDMPDCDGIEFSKTNLNKKIIFVTNYDTRVKEAFGPNVYGYVSKSNLEAELINNVTKIIESIKDNDTVCFKVGNQDVEIRMNDIIYCQYLGDENIAIIYNNKQLVLKNETLKNIFRSLNNNFMIINRHTIINKNKISKLSSKGIYLNGVNGVFEYSRRQKKEVIRAYYEGIKNV